jgi:hypothetical protein
MKDLIQINRFSELHNGENIFFCKTDFLQEAFRFIASVDNETVLISGNSDYCITDDLVAQVPNNIKKWFCQNKLCDNDLLEPIPLGIDNSIECAVPGHGKVWESAKKRVELLSKPYEKKPTKFVYANFSIETNPDHRRKIAEICKSLDYIDCDIVEGHQESNNRPYEKYLNSILDHEAIICPQGNGADQHRIYEALYLDRVPITFNKDQYDYLHHLFPTVLINSLEELEDQDNLKLRVEEAQNINKKYLTFQHWKNMILEAATN